MNKGDVMNKIKVIYVGVEDKPVKIWEGGKVLDKELYAYMLKVVEMHG